jgi:hypothetical protein
MSFTGLFANGCSVAMQQQFRTLHLTAVFAIHPRLPAWLMRLDPPVRSFTESNPGRLFGTLGMNRADASGDLPAHRLSFSLGLAQAHERGQVEPGFCNPHTHRASEAE